MYALKNNHQWFVHDSFEKASMAAATLLAEKINASIENNGFCHIILPGGNSPIQCLSFLIDRALPWDKINWYLSDERCYPLGHVNRNDVMLQKNLWSKISQTTVFSIPTELGAEEAAKQYRKIVDRVSRFDIAFLGLGEDGHTASLFPNNDALQDTRSVIPVFNAPKAPDTRVSLSIETLANAKFRMVLTGGKTKADAISKIKNGATLPINCLGDITWHVDSSAVKKG